MEEKRYVPVVVRVDEEGKKKPLAIEFEGKRYGIDKVLYKEPAACNSVGGVGIKYTCVVWGQVRELWEEKEQWFIVMKDERKKTPCSASRPNRAQGGNDTCLH